jgi:hypothetical protein
MYTAAFCVFLIPTLLTILAWKRWSHIRTDSMNPKWRFYCLIASLTSASLAIPIGLGQSFAWLHAGGDPHGMGTPPGIWVPLHQALLSVVLISVVFGLLAKGRGRFVGIAAAIATLISNMMVVLFNMD